MLENMADGADRHLRPNSSELDCRSAPERLALASGLQRIHPEVRLPWALRLLNHIQAEDARDPNLSLMTWYAIEPLIGRDRDETGTLLRAAQLTLVREFIARKATATDPVYMGMMLAHATPSPDPQVARDMLQGIIDGLGGTREVTMPSDWVTA